jgi:hypothetical protein
LPRWAFTIIGVLLMATSMTVVWLAGREVIQAEGIFRILIIPWYSTMVVTFVLTRSFIPLDTMAGGTLALLLGFCIYLSPLVALDVFRARRRRTHALAR